MARISARKRPGGIWTPPAWQKLFAVNTTGPALVASALLDALPHEGKSVFAALSARVGSVSDNRLGGWHAYRASKAALNQIIRTCSIELARKRRDALIVGLHPGTVETGLSEPFRGNVPDGKLFTPDYSAGCLFEGHRHADTEGLGALL